jgi:hypothetical protein
MARPLVPRLTSYTTLNNGNWLQRPCCSSNAWTPAAVETPCNREAVRRRHSHVACVQSGHCHCHATRLVHLAKIRLPPADPDTRARAHLYPIVGDGDVRFVYTPYLTHL